MNDVIKENPFVGLRPFEMHESLLFFGRQGQTIELLQRLHKHHFVGVVGSSGSGKSSLIRAGLIPALKAGYLVNDRDKWLIPVCKPGDGPIHNLVAAIFSELYENPQPNAIDAFKEKIEEEGADAIIEILEPVYNERRNNILVLVDQFEELFRFSEGDNNANHKNEASDFVNILLELAGNASVPVFVVMTMRSDFIGDCTQIFGLPEALNKSQYLVPRLTREQLKNAIEGPIKLYGGKINPALTTKVLNDVQSVQDELPLLQHCLMRTWDYEMKTDKSGELDVDDYAAIGGIEKALSRHADEAMADLNQNEVQLAVRMFKELTTTDYGGRKIRRPTHLNDLAQLTQVSHEEIYKLINHFNADKRCFIVVNKTVDNDNPIIDISHESLIRQWEKLGKWVEEESEAAKTYLRLSEAAKLNEEGNRGLLDGAELKVATIWLRNQQPSATWASRHNNYYEETLVYVEKSKVQEKRKHRIKSIRRIVYAIVGLLFFVIILTSVFFKNQSTIATKQRMLAENEKLRADRSEKIATYQMNEARRQAEKAEEAVLVATKLLNQLREERKLASIQRDTIIELQSRYIQREERLSIKQATKFIDELARQTKDTASIELLKKLNRQLQVPDSAKITPANQTLHSEDL